jgi:antitoxin (DNA-binding transcriptional repressor) of toxin-antitoxin stability system
MMTDTIETVATKAKPEIKIEMQVGNEYVLTRDGRPVMRVAPNAGWGSLDVTSYPLTEPTKSFKEAMLEIREMVQQNWRGDEPFDIREAIEDGRP